MERCHISVFCFVFPSKKIYIYYDGGREQFRLSAAGGRSVLLASHLAYKNIIKKK